MRVVFPFFFILLVGCGRIRFDEIGANDATATPRCQVWGPWGPSIEVPEFAGGAFEYDPAFAGTIDELWYVVGDTGDYNIMSVTRDGSGRYGNEMPASVNTTADENDPALSADGLDIMFVSPRPLLRVYEARRNAVDQPFGPAAIAVGLENSDIDSFDLAPDGLALYFELGTIMYIVTRPDRSSPFGTPTALGFDAKWPSISGDQLEVFFQRGTTGFTRSRASIADPFANEIQLTQLSPMLNGDFEVSPDGTELWMDDYGGGLYKKLRTCMAL